MFYLARWFEFTLKCRIKIFKYQAKDTSSLQPFIKSSIYTLPGGTGCAMGTDWATPQIDPSSACKSLGWDMERWNEGWLDDVGGWSFNGAASDGGDLKQYHNPTNVIFRWNRFPSQLWYIVELVSKFPLWV